MNSARFAANRAMLGERLQLSLKTISKSCLMISIMLLMRSLHLAQKCQ